MYLCVSVFHTRKYATIRTKKYHVHAREEVKKKHVSTCLKGQIPSIVLVQTTRCYSYSSDIGKYHAVGTISLAQQVPCLMYHLSVAETWASPSSYMQKSHTVRHGYWIPALKRNVNHGSKFLRRQAHSIMCQRLRQSFLRLQQPCWLRLWQCTFGKQDPCFLACDQPEASCEDKP